MHNYDARYALMELTNIKIFSEVIRQGSFAVVARQRNINPSTVSRSISILEADLGFRLFQRTTRKLAPTEAGRLYYSRIQSVIEELDRAHEQAHELVNKHMGVLRVSACTSFGPRILSHILPKLKSEYPELVIDLVLSDQQIDIIEEKIDLYIRFGSRPKGDFIASRLFDSKFRVCASPLFIRNNGAPQIPKDLELFDCLLFSAPNYGNIWKYRKANKATSTVSVSGRLITSHGQTLTICATTGMGIAMLPNWLCENEIESGELVNLFPQYEFTYTVFDTAAWLLYPSRSYMSLKLRTFIDFLRVEVRDYS